MDLSWFGGVNCVDGPAFEVLLLLWKGFFWRGFSWDVQY